MHRRLQQILDNAKHPRAKALLQDLFENDDSKKHMCERLEQIVCEQRVRLGYDMTTEAWIWDEEELNELGTDLLNRYIDKASRQLRKGNYGSGTIKAQTQKRMNRASGIKKANSRLNTYHTDEYSNTTNEGIANAIGNALKRVATQSIAHGLGVSASGLHKFGSDLLHTKTPKAPTMKKVVATKPQHPSPSIASLHTSPIHRTVTPGEVHSAIAKYPGEHEDHLNAFINHHNKGMEAKAKGDKSAAVVHFRARNHALVRYNQTAPKAHLKHLNDAKVQQMMSMNF